MDNRIGEMQVFLRVVEAKSYSEAARRLLMTPSTVSKLIGRIEARLGVRLFERSTRRLALTSEGQTYHDKSVALLAELDGIERGISQGAAAAGGTIRVNTTMERSGSTPRSPLAFSALSPCSPPSGKLTRRSWSTSRSPTKSSTCTSTGPMSPSASVPCRPPQWSPGASGSSNEGSSHLQTT